MPGTDQAAGRGLVPPACEPRSFDSRRERLSRIPQRCANDCFCAKELDGAMIEEGCHGHSAILPAFSGWLENGGATATEGFQRRGKSLHL
jgi:hypothetical protein